MLGGLLDRVRLPSRPIDRVVGLGLSTLELDRAARDIARPPPVHPLSMSPEEKTVRSNTLRKRKEGWAGREHEASLLHSRPSSAIGWWSPTVPQGPGIGKEEAGSHLTQASASAAPRVAATSLIRVDVPQCFRSFLIRHRPAEQITSRSLEGARRLLSLSERVIGGKGKLFCFAGAGIHTTTTEPCERKEELRT